MRHIFNYIKANPVVSITILFGFFLHMVVILPSGTYLCVDSRCGLFFWGVHGHDSIWHLAVSAVSFTHVPPLLPIFAGVPLIGYNSFLDFLLFLGQKAGIPSLISF